MVRNMMDLCKIADGYITYLESKGVKFNDDGYPIFEERMFLKELPKQILPYDFRKNRIVDDPRKLLLCFYCPDARIYPRLENVLG